MRDSNRVACSEDCSLYTHVAGALPTELCSTPVDTVLYGTSTPQSTSEHLQSAFDSLQLQLHRNKLAIQLYKMKWMLSTKNTYTESSNIISANGTCIEKVPQYKYLSIWLDNNLNFKHHINKSTYW